MPLAGIEPALLAELDFESSASTSSATGAFVKRRPNSGRGFRSRRNIAGGNWRSTRAYVIVRHLDSVKVIRCDEVQWRFLGLSLAGYNVLISLLMAAIAGWGLKSVMSAKR